MAGQKKTSRVPWGVVATAKAPARDILAFAAYHLEIGAARVIIFLDEPNPVAQRALRHHPKTRVTLTDEGNWTARGGRPMRHQTRQSRNATRAYRKQEGLDWLVHIDVDEFLISERGVSEVLKDIDPATDSLRLRPIERLAGGDGTAYKALVPRDGGRQGIVSDLYPEFGQFLRGGFLSHTAGKLCVRMGIANLGYRIHRTFVGGEVAPDTVECPGITVAHVHARDYDHWRAHFAFRHSEGSYRDELAPARPREQGGMTLHEVFAGLMEFEGELGLRKFFDEVVGDSPELRARLDRHGLLRIHDLELDAALARQFPTALEEGI